MYFDCRVVNCIPIVSFGLTSPFDRKLAFRDAWTVNPEHMSFHDPHVAVRFLVLLMMCIIIVIQLFSLLRFQSWSTELSLSDVRM